MLRHLLNSRALSFLVRLPLDKSDRLDIRHKHPRDRVEIRVVSVERRDAERVFHRDGIHDVSRDHPVDDGRPFVGARMFEGGVACAVWRSQIDKADIAQVR